LPTAGTTYTIEQMLADPVELNTRLGVYTNFVNLMDLAAVSVPAGFRPDGIPFGVSLIGPSLADGMLLTVADALHRSLAGARLGATPIVLSSTPPVAVTEKQAKQVTVAVVGAHLSGQPLNWQLVERGAKFVETTRTAPGYRLYALANAAPPKPGLVFDSEGRGGIEVELWKMDEAAFGSFVALIPAPLGIGTLTLADGRTVKGFLCEAHAVRGAEDITTFGGWRAWLARSSDAQQNRASGQARKRDLMASLMAVAFALLFMGAMLARGECKSGTLMSQVCAVLTEPGVQLGSLPRFW
jgi:allophanate hydrolase